MSELHHGRQLADVALHHDEVETKAITALLARLFGVPLQAIERFHQLVPLDVGAHGFKGFPGCPIDGEAQDHSVADDARDAFIVSQQDAVARGVNLDIAGGAFLEHAPEVLCHERLAIADQLGALDAVQRLVADLLIEFLVHVRAEKLIEMPAMNASCVTAVRGLDPDVSWIALYNLIGLLGGEADGLAIG